MVADKVERIELLEALQLGVVDYVNRPLEPSFYSEKLSRLVDIGKKNAAAKNVLSHNSDYTKAEQVVTALRVSNSKRKPA
jgi:hypothetical protein